MATNIAEADRFVSAEMSRTGLSATFICLRWGAGTMSEHEQDHGKDPGREFTQVLTIAVSAAQMGVSGS